ncbi:TetR family transcriptional regulator [Serratia sp. MYb239]|uniref:TetR/AcrR family transcriptional regulator n=1 Tax=Serratia sp. MYb239 TaxID=2033438 RepID=UPI000CF6E2D5|nr:TetR/AcrR family transcriptional regulator [Serratia sp. MYb239]AVJ15707.1 TetR family transcriptional regulator [Serratia sp. MYb239]
MAKLGRPASFNREVALKQAMDIFWSKGYIGTQLVDLTTAMKINPPSFYAAFGSKKQAFYEAVELYISSIGSKSMIKLMESDTAANGLCAMLESTVKIARSNEAGGCLLMLSLINPMPNSDEEWLYLKNIRQKTLSLICARIEQGIADGDLPKSTQAKALASFFFGITQAISLQARDGASEEELTSLIEPAMSVLSPK